MSERDLFANFERMRREMDELFGGVFDRSLAPHRRGGFTPRVDVSYVGDPPRAIVTAELAGIDIEQIDLEIRGRELIIAGIAGPPDDAEGRVYQQIEIEHGPFRRAMALGADVAADRAAPPTTTASSRRAARSPTRSRGPCRIEVARRDADPGGADR